MASFDFCIPQAQRLADLSGVHGDLLMVRQIVSLYLGLPPGRDNLVLKDALCVSAVTTYARTCATGVRERIGNLVEELPNELQETHKYVMHMRNKWAAHSVNEHESYHVTLDADLCVQSNQVIPQSVHFHSSITVFLAAPKMLALAQLAESLSSIVLRELNSEERKLLEHAKSMDLSGLVENPGMYSCSAPSNPRAYKRRISFR